MCINDTICYAVHRNARAKLNQNKTKKRFDVSELREDWRLWINICLRNLNSVQKSTMFLKTRMVSFVQRTWTAQI